MNTELAPVISSGSTHNSLPSIFTARPDARKRLRDFFSSHIRNRNTRRAIWRPYASSRPSAPS